MYIWKIWRFEDDRITRSKHVDRMYIAAQKSLATPCLTCCFLRRSLSSNENPVTVTRSYFFVNLVNFLFSFVNLFEIGQALHLQIRPCVSHTAWYKTVRDESISVLVTGPDATVRVQTRCICNRHGALSSSAWFTLKPFFPNILLNSSLLLKLQYYRDVRAMRSVVTFVNCIHAIKIAQFGRLGTPFILIFLHVWPVSHPIITFVSLRQKRFGTSNKKEFWMMGATFTRTFGMNHR
jgi:hypothetical protein